MSHFTVLVTGDDVDGALAPFHEFECTGKDNQYVQTIDITEETFSRYLKETQVLFVSPEGERISKYSDRFYAGNQFLGCPEGWSEVTIYTKDTTSFEDWLKEDDYKLAVGEPDLNKTHKYGYYTLGSEGPRVFRRTNPNKHWDWYVIGGRFKDRLRHKNGSHCNSLRAGDLDLNGLIREAEARARSSFAKYQHIFEGQTFPLWEDILEQHKPNFKLAQETYNNHPLVKAIHEHSRLLGEFIWSLDEEFQGGDLEKVLHLARLHAFPFFAVLDQGVWRERGSMGWWGCVSNEKTPEDWNTQLTAWLQGLDPETQLTLVDCHI